MNLAAAATQHDRVEFLQASIAALEALCPTVLNAACPVGDPVAAGYDTVASREGEETASVGAWTQLRAVYSTGLFWRLASLLPHNDLGKQRYGRPQDYPDWLLFLFVCIAGITGIATRNNAIAFLADPQLWAQFVADVDRFVPDGFTRLSDLAPTDKKSRNGRAITEPKTEWNANVVPLKPRTQAVQVEVVPPPRAHHLDHFAKLWCGYHRVVETDEDGKRKQTYQPQPVGHAWYGVRAKVYKAFREHSTAQAIHMGLMDPDQSFTPSRPDRNQFSEFDGTVFRLAKKHTDCPSAAFHTVGGETKKVYGSKFTLASCRVNGQRGSRVILDFAHCGTSPDSPYGDEAAATVAIAKTLLALTNGGMRGIMVDSVIRGQHVIDLERVGVHVINYPHAKSNPDGGPGKRLNPTRVEKSHIRKVASYGQGTAYPCHHAIYFVGGEIIHLSVDPSGKPTPKRLDPVKRYTRPNKDGTFRHYVDVKIGCTINGTHTVSLSLFHTEAMSSDPDYNWGEVARYYPPSSPEFQYLYGARNDSEARHADLKSRLKYLPRDVRGQELRLLGASIVINSTAWQIHLQAHGQPNVFDNTA